jgi:hypothetical protein
VSALLNRYLVTGDCTLEPKPSIPHVTYESARESAEKMLRNEGFKQHGAIIWVPLVHVTLERPLPPVKCQLLAALPGPRPTATFQSEEPKRDPVI